MTPDTPPAASTSPATSELAELLRLEQTRLAYDYLSISQAVAVLNAIVMVIAQSLVINPVVLVLWFGAIALVAVIRIIGRAAFQQAAPDPEDVGRWRMYIVVGAVASGLVWGSAAIFLYPPTNVPHQVFIAFILGGMVAGSVTTLAPVYPAFVAYATLVLVPVVVRFAWQGDVVHFAMGWLILVFLLAMLGIARRSQLGVETTLKLKVENARLTGELIAAKEKIRLLRPGAGIGRVPHGADTAGTGY